EQSAGDRHHSQPAGIEARQPGILLVFDQALIGRRHAVQDGIPSSARALTRAAGSYLATSRTLAPNINTMVSSDIPTIWETGSTQHCVSSGVICRSRAVSLALNSRLRCES